MWNLRRQRNVDARLNAITCLHIGGSNNSLTLLHWPLATAKESHASHCYEQDRRNQQPKTKYHLFTEKRQAAAQTKHILPAPCAALENDLLLNIRWSKENVNTPRFCFLHWHVVLGAKVSIQVGMTAMRHQAGLNLTWQDMLEAANKWQIIKARSYNMHLLLSGMYIPPGPGKRPYPKKRITFQRKEVKANSRQGFF